MEEVDALSERRMRADQKLVSFMVLPSGRSRMKWPRFSCVQSPCTRASEVHTYVFCYLFQCKETCEQTWEHTGTRSSSSAESFFPRYGASAHS